MQVREITRGDEKHWDAYVRKSIYSTPQHLSAWKRVMEEVFNSETHYLFAENNGEIVGVLPIIHINNLIIGNYLTSLPGGMCCESNEAAAVLLNYAIDIVKASKANYLILRDGRKKWELPGMITDEEHVTCIIEMTPELDQLRKAMKSKTRQLVNQSSNNGLTIKLGLQNLNEYYPVYSKSMRELGTPTMGVKFFKAIATHLTQETDLITIHHQEKIVGGGFIGPFKETIYCLWSGLLRDYYDLRTPYMLSWAAIKYAHERGYKYVDLGRCRKNSGGYDFKLRFGSHARQLYQQVYLNGVNRVPKVGSELRADKNYRVFVTAWRALPQSITEALGPVLRKHMPFG
jgi:FemAB-related protein (PEP-CTERM system-associated)